MRDSQYKVFMYVLNLSNIEHSCSLHVVSFPRPSPPPVFDHLHIAKTRGRGGAGKGVSLLEGLPTEDFMLSKLMEYATNY